MMDDLGRIGKADRAVVNGAASIAALRASIPCAIALPVGSRVTCSPPPVDTDEDWLVLVQSDPCATMLEEGFTQDGSPQFYTGNDNGGFRSWRRGNVNIITTPDSAFFDKFMTATALAKRFNLLAKADRIALFQAVLYGVHWKNLEHRPAQAIEARSDEPLRVSAVGESAVRDSECAQGGSNAHS